MQYTKFMNDNDVDDTKLFDSEETEASGTNIDVEEILVSQFPPGRRYGYLFLLIFNYFWYILSPNLYIYIYIYIYLISF